MILLSLFLIFFKIGAFTFGGGYAMLPMIEQEVEAHGWMQEEELVNFIAVSEATPGPFAINISTYVGTEVGGSQWCDCSNAWRIDACLLTHVSNCRNLYQISGILDGKRDDEGAKTCGCGSDCSCYGFCWRTGFYWKSGNAYLFCPGLSAWHIPRAKNETTSHTSASLMRCTWSYGRICRPDHIGECKGEGWKNRIRSEKLDEKVENK